jgi:hypothetical protein
MMRSALALFAAACSAAAPRPAAPTDNPMAPVTLSVEVSSGVPVVGTEMTLRAHVQRNGPWAEPIAVSFRLPAGVVRTDGILTGGGTVTAGDDAEIAVRLDTLPGDDLVAVADSQGNAAGFHAEAHYRFGRPAPVKTGPERTGPATRMNGHDLGASVPMDP